MEHPIIYFAALDNSEEFTTAAYYSYIFSGQKFGVVKLGSFDIMNSLIWWGKLMLS